MRSPKLASTRASRLSNHRSHRFVSRHPALLMALALAAAAVLIYVSHSSAAGGDIDPAFNAGGAGADNSVLAVAVQPDGKIVIGGNFISYNGDAAASDYVMRLNADGTRDTTFNASGTGANNSVLAVAVQPDGKIVIGGDFTTYNGDAAASDDVMRLNADGTRDTTFNAGGAGANGGVNAVAVQPDGKIVIGGQFTSYNGNAAASDFVMRLNADGTNDTTFNASGAGANDYVLAVAVQPDGKIVIGGLFTSYNGDGAASDNIMRLNADGTRDTTFNVSGTGANNTVRAVAVQPDGKIVIGGDFTSYNGNAAASDMVMRLNADGTRDTTFNASGAGANNSVYAVAVQVDGKIVIGGRFASYNGDAAASDYVMRLNADGTRDATFNASGAGADSFVLAVAVQPDGKIVTGGEFSSYNGDTAAPDSVIRLLPAPGTLAFSSSTYDVTEGSNATITVKRTGGTDNQVVGKVTLTDVTTSPADYRFTPGARAAAFNLSGAGADTTVRAVALQPDGKIVIGGDFTSYNGDAAASDWVMRLNADGTRDTTFNAGGVGANSQVYAVALQPDGKIVIGGLFSSYNGDAAASDKVMRLNADGTRDTTFNALGAGANNGVLAVAVQPDGKIVIGGDFTSYNGDAAASDRVMRLNADGTRDTTFNAGGAGADSGVLAVAVQPDGKIVIGGIFQSYNGDAAASDNVMRLNADGTRDTTFNAGGAGADNAVLAVALQPDGKIVIGGFFQSYNGDAAASDWVMRLNADGTRDTTFNAGGAGANDGVYAVAVQPDGKIVIGGQFTSYNGDAAASDYVMRLKADGTRDTTFNAGGAGADNGVLAVALQSDGKIVIGGAFTSYNGDAAASDYVMRLDGDLFVTWPAGDATDRVILLPIVNDGTPEGDETLTLTLAVMSGGATLGSPNSATLTIHDPNTPPTITAAGPLTRQQGATSNSTIATVNDTESGAGGVTVTVTSANPSNGVTISTIVNTSGTVTADVAASCTATNATFTLQASDGTATATDTLTVNVTATPTPPITPTPAEVCANSTGNSAAGPAGATTYAWSIVNGTITSATNIQTITYTAGASGTVDLTLVTTNASGCSASNTVNVTINANPATPPITPAPAQVCANSTGNSASGPAGATTYAWSIVNGTITSATNIQTITYTAGASGTVDLTLVVTNASGCSASNTVNVPINPNPSAAITASSQVCSGSTGNAASVANAGVGATYVWGITNGTITGGAGTANITFTAGAAGTLTLNVTVTSAAGCSDSKSANVTVNSIPATPTITPSGPTTFCAGGSVTLTSSSASGNQWLLNGNPIGGATANTYVATASGNYTAVVTDVNSCTSAASAATSVTVNPIPATPTITPGGPTTFCTGGSVTLNSSAASGNQWSLNGNPIGGATSQSYVATASGNYTVIDTALGCSSAPSAATAVTVNPNPNATITTAAQECAGSTGNAASVANAGVGATYNWSITNGTITGGTGTANITYTAGAAGTLTLNLTVTTAAGCSDSKSANVTVNAIPTKPTVTPGGPTTFANGGSVTLNSSSASGNQWFLNGNPIGGATSASFVATAAGNYTVVVTTSGCSSPASDATTVTICASAPVVTNANDSGAGSLRQAILDACDGATITFDMSQVVSPINLTSAGLVINKNLTINGPGANLLTIQRSTAGATPQFGIFTINSGTTVSISGLTLSNGNASTGGGINNQGALTLTGCTISGNSVNGTNTLGGGISNGTTSGTATLTINRSTISGNSTNGSNSIGGGIVNSTGSGTATLTITNSTISGNSANGGTNFGGGIYNAALGGTATLTITNSTISGNSVNGGGGAIYTTGTGTVTVLSRNTIVAGNTKSSGTTPDDINGSVDATSSFNLIGTGGSGGLTNGVNNNQVGVANVLLAPLANYGGPTQTLALLPGSPALNAGSNPLANNAGLTTDQRGAGFNRIVNSTVDIGAFESRGFTVSATSGSGQSTVFSTAFSSPLLATVSSAFAEPVVGGQLTFSAPGSGASATFTGGVTTLNVALNASGQGNASATANAIVGGPYNVAVNASGIATAANFSLTNVTSNQTITFGALTNKTFGDADFTVSATASSGLPVSFTASGNCTINTNTVHLTGAGSCTITAKQTGNSNFSAAPDVPRTFAIAQAATTTVVNTSANPSNLTQSVTFTATVTGPAGTGTPTGTVQFKDNGTNLGSPVALNGSGVAQVSTSALTAGTHTITADFSGDTNFGVSTGTLSGGQVVNNRPLISLSQSSYSVNEVTGFVTITVNRAGDVSVPVTVDYATDDTGASNVCSAINTGLASSRCDFGLTLGTLRFAATETQKTFVIPISQDSFTEGPEVFTVNLSNATGTNSSLTIPFSATVTINDSAAPAPNANDDTDAFVRQQYRDFLNREADPAGLLFWTNQITSCGADAACREIKRINVSAAFFLSVEFQTTGNLVRSFYVAALNRPLTNNMPGFTEFERDTEAMQRGLIVDPNNNAWQTVLNNNRDAFMRDFVTRAEFVGLYPTTDTPTQYVDRLYLHAVITPTASERANAIAEFGGAGTATDAGARGRALLDVTQNATFQQKEMNRSFVQMEYFGYLRRNPNDAPDGNFAGYDFWVTKLNAFGGNYISSEMVKAFISSGEYRRRFGP